jgi:hypothetical protein
MPDKYTNLNQSVVNNGGVIMKSYYNCSIQKYDDLENHVAALLGDNARLLFVQALSFLYALGKISYQPSSDSVNLVQL